MAFRTVLRSDIVEPNKRFGRGPRLRGGVTEFWMAYLSGVDPGRRDFLESHQRAGKSKRVRLRLGARWVCWVRDGYCVGPSPLRADA